MVRSSFFDENGKKKGVWDVEEDNKLRSYIQENGIQKWHDIPKAAGLSRCEKSCRLRWINYLRPDVKRGNYTKQEECLLIKLHQELGNKWAAIAKEFPGRSDNDIKNYWHTHIKKRYTKQKHIHRRRLKKQLHATPSSSEKSIKLPLMLDSSELAIRSSSEILDSSELAIRSSSEISSISNGSDELRFCNGDHEYPPSNAKSESNFLDDLEEYIRSELLSFDTQFSECNNIYSIFNDVASIC